VPRFGPLMRSFDLAITVFGVIFVAELPDKTALTALVLATKYRPAPVFLGTALALAIQSAVAVVAGSLLSLLPPRPVHIGAGVVFLLSAAIMWMRKEPAADGPASLGNRRSFWGTFAGVFGVVFLAEWGDLTQLATAAFAAREHAPWIVFVASTLALWAVAGVAVVVGRHTAKFLSPHTARRVAAVLFAAIGVALLTGVL
jgi:putative Ca2+/H+ antiporter (TMEM165/GDT1 family)